jgi:hypothetical protein
MMMLLSEPLELPVANWNIRIRCGTLLEAKSKLKITMNKVKALFFSSFSVF